MDPKQMFGGHEGSGFRARRGGLAPTILRLLSEKPMHGYEIITTLAAKTSGMWRPSAGAVYPTLQLLEDQDLVAGKDEGGKRVYSLTKRGQKQARLQTDRPAWDDERIATLRAAAKRRVVLETIRLMRSIALTGTDKDRAAAEQILTRANDKLKRLSKEGGKKP